MKRKIKTTINIKPYLKKRIIDASKACDVYMSTIINLIILKIIDKLKYDPDYSIEMCASVKYQEKYKPLKWDQLHITYDPDVYEVANDLRKLLKKTVSKYIAEGIEEFLDEIVKDLCENKEEITGDNYFPSYIFVAKEHKKSISFTVFWGHPIREILENYIIE